jgi:hypothetical protein
MGLMLLKQEIGWFLPRKTFHENLLDSLLTDPQLLNKNENSYLVNIINFVKS